MMTAGRRAWRAGAFAALMLAITGALVLLDREPRTRESSPPASPLATSTSQANGTAFAGNGMKKEPGACAVMFDKDEAHFSDDAIRLALLGDDPNVVTDCRGRAIPVIARKPQASVLSSLARADEAMVDDAGLGGTVVARVSVGNGPSPCAGDIGVIALVAIRGRRLVADALAPWEAPCGEGASEPLELVDIGREHALLEEDGNSTERGSVSFSRVWLRRGTNLVRAGAIVTSVTENERTMSAELDATKRGLVATETWTLGDEADGDARTVVVDRTYTVRGDVLIRTPEADP